MNTPTNGPIVIGANCGSGTRVLAEILIHSNVFLGNDLNDEKDDLTFTFVFKHPARFYPDFKKPSCDNDLLFELHERLLFQQRPKGIKQWKMFFNLAKEHARGRYDWHWAKERLINTYRKTTAKQTKYWGWKEPYSLFHLHGLARRYPSARYIHVIRHGLDMVYCGNLQQFHNWGAYFDIDANNHSRKNKFEFWYRSNKYAIETARELFGKRFMLIKFEDLCQHPEESILRIYNFLEIDKTEPSQEITSIPRTPKSFMRYKRHDTNWIDDSVIAKLSRLSYQFNND